jgi:putative phage-type endonuclease
MFQIIEFEQRTPEWHEFRRKHIGARDAMTVMGIDPWKSIYQLWLEKCNLDVVGKNFTSRAAQRGIDLEPIALECFNRYIGCEYKPCIVESYKYPWMSASLDGIHRDCIVEIKCPNIGDHLKALSGQVPEKYYPQLQHQLAVTGFEYAYYFSFDGEDGIYLKVDRDDEYIENLIAKEKEFWECVNNLVEPKDKYIHREELEWKHAVESYKKANALYEQANKERELARDTLIALAGDQTHCRGAGITLQKCMRKGNLNLKALEAAQIANLESYRSPSTFGWRINIDA